MTRRSLSVLLLVLVIVGCGGSDDAKGPTATVGTDTTAESTTTTAKALTPEQEVEAAYLKSWDVYAKAALALDPAGLEKSYDGDALEIVRQDIAKFKKDNTPARFKVDHDYTITISTAGVAAVADNYVNHSVLLDPTTRQPTEADPNKRVSEVYLLKEVDGTWKVITIQGSDS